MIEVTFRINNPIPNTTIDEAIEIINGWRYCKDEILVAIEQQIENTCSCGIFVKAGKKNDRD